MIGPTQRKVLAMTSLRAFWGEGEPDALLGRWCLCHPLDSERPDLVARVLPYPWETRAARVGAYRYCIDLKHTLLTELAELLNTHHGVSYSLRSWNLMIGPWLQRMVMVSYHHYRCLDEARRWFPDAVVLGPVRGVSPPPATSMRLFFDLHRDYRHQMIFTHFAEELGFACERLQPSPADLPDGQGPRVARSRIGFVEWAYRRIRSVPKYITEILARNAECVLYNATPTPQESFQLGLSSAFRIVPLPMFSLEDVVWPMYDARLREEVGRKLRQHSVRDAFAKSLVALLPGLFPISLLEGFGELRQQVANYFPRQPRNIVSSMAWVGDDAFCLWAAEQSEKGVPLISAQHGGTYGVREMVSPSEMAESEVADLFISWGPKTQVCAVSIQLPVLPHFYVKRSRKAVGNLLFIGGISALLPYGFASAVDGPDVIANVESQHAFFAALPEKYLREFLMRPYPVDVGWNEKARLDAAFPGIAYDDHSVDLVGRLSQARLAVIDNMHSTYMQSIGSGIPTILFWDPERWPVNERATPDFEKLHEAGVLHFDPISAATKVAEVADDPMVWWQSQPVSDAVKNFLDGYFNVDSAWLSAWRRELLNYSGLADGYGDSHLANREC